MKGGPCSTAKPYILAFSKCLAERSKHDRWCRLWVLTVVVVHIVFFISGLVVLSHHWLSRQPTPNTLHIAPGNDKCPTSDFLLHGNVIRGTTLGATEEHIPCDEDEIFGTWCGTVGTGRNILISSGPCNNLECKSFYWRRSKRDGTDSVLWSSRAGELYHVFINSHTAGNFSLSLDNTPSAPTTPAHTSPGITTPAPTTTTPAPISPRITTSAPTSLVLVLWALLL
jgi:hypothetical protein